MDQKTPGIKYFPIQPSHWVNTNKIHEFLTPNNSHSSLLNNLPINLSSKRLGPCKLGHVVVCSYLPHMCPLEQHGVCPMTLQPSHFVNTNKIHEFLTPNNSHLSLLNNLPINLSSKRLGPCKLGHVVFCSYLPHVCPLEQHRVCPMTLGKHNLQPWLPHLVAYKMLVFFFF